MEGADTWAQLGGWYESGEHRCRVHTTVWEVDSWWEAAAHLREPSSALCDDLDSRMGAGVGGKLKRAGICLPVANSLCCTVKINTTLQQLYSN